MIFRDAFQPQSVILPFCKYSTFVYWSERESLFFRSSVVQRYVCKIVAVSISCNRCFRYSVSCRTGPSNLHFAIAFLKINLGDRQIDSFSSSTFFADNSRKKPFGQTWMENIHVVPKRLSSEIPTHILVIKWDHLRTHNDFPWSSDGKKANCSNRVLTKGFLVLASFGNRDSISLKAGVNKRM